MQDASNRKTLSKYVFTLLTHTSTVFLHKSPTVAARPMLPDEKLDAMGWEVWNQSLCKIHSVLKYLDSRQKSHLAGNGYICAVLGMHLAWFYGATEEARPPFWGLIDDSDDAEIDDSDRELVPC